MRRKTALKIVSSFSDSFYQQPFERKSQSDSKLLCTMELRTNALRARLLVTPHLFEKCTIA